MTNPDTQHLPRLGRYQVLNKIAEGGMAEIFLAKSLGAMGFERLVAIKLIRPHLTEDSDFVKMFLDEARIAMQLHHRNIVQTFDLEKADETFFIAMEYVHGVNVYDLYERIAASGRWIELPLALYMISEACKGLHFAHTRTNGEGDSLGIIHRDISPQNILLSFEGEVKIMDFGIAKAAERLHHTTPGIVKGKYAYMAPEVLRDAPVDARVDVFAAGVVLYELLTGENPFAGTSAVDTIENVLNLEVEPPTSKSGAGSFELDAIVLKSLTKDPDKRFQSAREFSDALTDHGLSLTGARWDIAAGDASVSALLNSLFPERANRTFTPSAAERVAIPLARSQHQEPITEPPDNPQRAITEEQNYADQETMLRVPAASSSSGAAGDYDEEAQTALVLELTPELLDEAEPRTSSTLPPEPATDRSLVAMEEEGGPTEERTVLRNDFLADQLAMDSISAPPQAQTPPPSKRNRLQRQNQSANEAGFVSSDNQKIPELDMDQRTPGATDAIHDRGPTVPPVRGRGAAAPTAIDGPTTTAPILALRNDPTREETPQVGVTTTKPYDEGDARMPDHFMGARLTPERSINSTWKALILVILSIVIVISAFMIRQTPVVTVPVTSFPSGASVTINGELQVTKTPLNAILPVGRQHKFEISAPGYKTFTRNINPKAEDALEIHAVLSPQ